MQLDQLNSRAVNAISSADRQTRIWREWELLLVVLVVGALYFPRLTSLTIRGEESRWARVAQEMIDSGDWIVPTQQGQPFPDRPPLGSWAIMAAAQLTGELDLAAVRLPAVTATLATALLIYLYSRNFLSRVGAFAAALAYPTMAQVLQLGRMGESDSLLTLFLAGALFVWHFGYACRRSPRLSWCGGYALAALAGLTKGPQGPVYFIAVTTVYVAALWDWRFWLNRWHLAGAALFVTIVGAWQIPFYMAVDADTARATWFEGGELAKRFEYHGLGRTLLHWISYPCEVFACTMPWSFMLPTVATRWFRDRQAEIAPLVSFLVTACVVTFPTCWLPAETRPRYFMSLFPAVAILCGAAVQRSWAARPSGWWQRSWDRFLVIGVILIFAASAGVALIRLFDIGGLFGLSELISPAFALAFAVGGIVSATAVIGSRRRKSLYHAHAGIAAVAAFWGLVYTGLVINAQVRAANDPSGAIAAVRAEIPLGEPLVSFRPVHHLFAYYFRQPIELYPVLDDRAPNDFDGTYFCFLEDPSIAKLRIPFDWEPVAEISCERVRRGVPLTKVTVGKRIAAIPGVRHASHAAPPPMLDPSIRRAQFAEGPSNPR